AVRPRDRVARRGATVRLRPGQGGARCGTGGGQVTGPLAAYARGIPRHVSWDAASAQRYSAEPLVSLQRVSSQLIAVTRGSMVIRPASSPRACSFRTAE